MSEIEKNKEWISHKATILTPEGEIKDVIIKTIYYDEEISKDYSKDLKKENSFERY